MSLKINGSKEKSTTSSTSNTSSTTTPIVPEWAKSLTENVAGRVGELNRADPYGFVAPAHDLQSQAAAGARGLTGMSDAYQAASGLLGGAAGQGPSTYQASLGGLMGYGAQTYAGAQLGAAPQIGAASVLDNLQAYYNPFREQITDPVLADLDVNASRTRAQQDLDLAGAGAFGGSGAALTKSMTEGELARGRAAALSALLNDMFKTSAGMAEGDAGRRQQSMMTNADLTARYGLAQAGFEQEAGLSNRDAANRAAEFGAGAFNAQSQANQAALNEAGRFNAQASEQALQRQMQGARDLADFANTYEAGQRANIAAQAGLGETLRGIDQDYRQAPITHGQQIVAMLNGLPISLFTGQQMTGTESSTGTSKGTKIGFEASK